MRATKYRLHFEIGRMGSAGLIVTILVMGYLMAISTSHNTLVITEGRGTTAGNNRIKALAAAYSGLSFYQGLLLATTTTFDRLTPDDCRKRFHFSSLAPIGHAPLLGLPGRLIATNSSGVMTGAALAWYSEFTNLATSTWLYASSPGILPTTWDIPSSSVFIVKTYVDVVPVNLASYVYVKSLGCYREIENNEVIASYYAQILARIEISTAASALHVDRMMQMPLEFPFSNTAPFFASMSIPWK